MNRRAVEEAVRALLVALDVENPETKNTPERVARMWMESLVDGEHKNSDQIMRRLSRTQSRETIVLRKIEAHSVCPHHLLPYELEASIAFVPDGYTAGFSRIAEYVDARAHRLVLLEELSRDLADGLQLRLKAKGVAVMLRSRHGCMVFQGTARRATTVDAFAFRGSFEKDVRARAQVQALLLGAR
jgi:GTP cyclohydrolase IA